jgi:hypothetical protein
MYFCECARVRGSISADVSCPDLGAGIGVFWFAKNSAGGSQRPESSPAFVRAKAAPGVRFISFSFVQSVAIHFNNDRKETSRARQILLLSHRL